VIFGLNLPNYSGLGNRESMVAIAAKAEELGYSSLWTSWLRSSCSANSGSSVLRARSRGRGRATEVPA
jgi:hypothetical protein